MITGAGRRKGLGAGIARKFAERGSSVVITDIGKPSGKHLPPDHIGTDAEMYETAQFISELTGSVVEAMSCDVRDEDAIIRTINKIVERFGHIDVAVNNAGIGYIMKPLMELEIDDWDVVLDVNLRGAFLVTKHTARQFVAQGKGGRIINIASQAAKSPAPLLSHYTSSKHGMIGLTRTAAVELGVNGITVNAVCPNHVTTGLGEIQNTKRGEVLGTDLDGVLAFRKSKIPLGRVGLVEDTANLCVFLASDEAEYITGEGINVSGGEEMH